MRAIGRLFNSNATLSKPSEIILWWEFRRIPYNLIVGVIGAASVVGMVVVGSAAVPAGEDFEEPLGLIFGIILFALLANVAFTFGWVIELIRKEPDPNRRALLRARAFRRGLLWSCLLASFPFWAACVVWIIHAISG